MIVWILVQLVLKMCAVCLHYLKTLLFRSESLQNHWDPACIINFSVPYTILHLLMFCPLSRYDSDCTWLWSCIFNEPPQVASFLKCWQISSRMTVLYLCSTFISFSTRAHNLFLFIGTRVISYLSSLQGFGVLVEMNVQLSALHFPLCCHQWKSHLSCSGLSFPFERTLEDSSLALWW